MKSCLILLTKKYPFDSGEEFIENEIPFLARGFGRVILIATSVSDSPVQTRDVPDGVEVHFLRSSDIRRAVLPAAVRYAVGTMSGLPERDRREAGGSLKRRLFLSYFLAKSEQVRKGCAEILKGAALNQYDGATFYSYWFYDTAAAAADLKQACGLKRVRAVSRAHRYDLYAEQNPAGFLPLRFFLLQNLDRVYPCSRDGRDSLVKKYPEFAAKIRTSYLGTADHGLAPDPESGIFHLVSCCHISPVKRVGLLARSLVLLKDSGLNLKWTHFGGGEGLGELKNYARENLSFLDWNLEGEISNSRLMEFYRHNPVNCFINTSSSEGLPVSIMEAASFGIPILATDVGGTGEIVQDGKNGFLLPCDVSPEKLAQTLEQTFRMPKAQADALRRGSRKIWEENFCSERNYARFSEEISPDAL